MTECVWASPGGLYVVPSGWRKQLLAEFPGYRVRWSLKKACWQLEQPVGSGSLPPLRIDQHDDSLIRASDGYWLVMEFQPGDRMPCPGIVQVYPRLICGATLKVPHKVAKETICQACRKAGRDGRTIAVYWPFGEALLEHLRYSDPLRDGTRRQSRSADATNAKIIRDGEWAASNALTSIDAVDYRWLSDIPAAGVTRRKIDHTTFR